MKKIIVALFIVINIFVPVCSYASILDEVPPYVEIIGINESDYIISKTLKENEILIELEEKDTGFKYSWSFDKDKIKDKIKLNFNIDFNSKKQNEIESITGDMDKIYLSFAHHGDLPSNAKIKVDVSNKFKDKDKLYLYYYNEDKKQVEFIDNNIVVKDGYAEFELEHCSEYFLTGAVVNDAQNNPKSLNSVIIILFGFVMILMTYTLFRK